MAVEYSAPLVQTVADNGNILFTASNPRWGVRSINWREGAGIISLAGACGQISVRNTSGTPIDVQNAVLIVERKA